MKDYRIYTDDYIQNLELSDDEYSDLFLQAFEDLYQYIKSINIIEIDSTSEWIIELDDKIQIIEDRWFRILDFDGIEFVISCYSENITDKNMNDMNLLKEKIEPYFRVRIENYKK